MLAIAITAKWRRYWLPFSNGWCGALLLIVLAPAALADPVNLDSFIGGLENGCELSKPLEIFREELSERYRFEIGVERLKTKVNIPPSIKDAVGAAKAIDHSEYTTIEVPLIGKYRGLSVRTITFDIGHSNGVAVTTLVFGESASIVENAIGSDVAHTTQKFEADPETKLFGFSAKIIPQGETSILVCNTSI